jgi:hypothetical protein
MVPSLHRGRVSRLEASDGVDWQALLNLQLAVNDSGGLKPGAKTETRATSLR